MRTARAFSALICITLAVLQSQRAYGDGANGGNDSPPVPSIYVQNRASNVAIVSLVSGDTICGKPLRVPSGEIVAIELSCRGNRLKLRIWDPQKSDYVSLTIADRRTYETYADGPSWAIKDVTNEATR
jgi:hypothetical protein